MAKPTVPANFDTRLPPPSSIKQRLGEHLREVAFLRRLLRLSEQQTASSRLKRHTVLAGNGKKAVEA